MYELYPVRPVRGQGPSFGSAEEGPNGGIGRVSAPVFNARCLLTCLPCLCFSQVQPHAEAFGRACKLEQSKVANFGEEVVRGQPLFLVSQLLQVRHVC